MDMPPPKDPWGYPLLTYLWVLAISIWAGVVSFIRKVRSGESRAFNVAEFVGEIFTSGFVGLLTFWGAEAAGFSPLWSAVLIGVSAHMGTKALNIAEKWLHRRYGDKEE